MFAAWNVTTLDVIENEVMLATAPHVAPVQAPGCGITSVISVSGWLFGRVLMLLLVVATSAIDPASQMLTYMWLLSSEAVVNMRNRVVPGTYVAAGMHEVTGGTAYCAGENCGVDSSDSDGVVDAGAEDGVLTVMLAASNTVSTGIMQGVDPT